MINLLPPGEQKELALKKNKKLVIVLGNAVIIGMVSLILVLFSLKFYILQDVSYYKNILDTTAKNQQAPDTVLLRGVIEKYNASLVRLDDFYKKESRINDALKTVFQIARPSGLYLKSVIVDRTDKDGRLKLSVTGSSDTRDNLLAFKNNIEKTTGIESLYFPPDSWIKSKNVSFAITLEIPKHDD